MQYGFHKEIREFGDNGQEATKQKLYEILLVMDKVMMIKSEELEKDLCCNALTYLIFLK